MVHNIKRQLTIIFLIFYFIPFLYSLFRLDYLKNFYRIEKNSIFILFFIILFFWLTYFFSTLKSLKLGVKLLPYLFSKIIVFIFSVVFFGLSLYYFKNFGLSFRQSSEGLSTNGPILFTHLILKNYFKVVIFYELTKQVNTSARYFSRITLALILASLVFSLSGSLDVLVILFSTMILFESRQLRLLNSFRFLFNIVIAILFILFIGISNKIGVYQTFEIFRLENFKILTEHLIRRISTWYFSIEVIQEKYMFSYAESSRILSSILENLRSRFLILFGSPKNSPEIWSLSRQNYLLLFQDNSNIRSGASPGLVASSFLYFPFNFIILTFIFGQILRKINSLFYRKSNLLVDIYVVLVIVYPIIASPIDIINFVGPSAILIILLYSAIENLENRTPKIRSNESY